MFLQNVSFLSLGSGAGSEFKLFCKMDPDPVPLKGKTQRDGEYT
jgi:hypothetical protein